MNDRKGQVWIETVLYTLIGLALIGIVLAIALPQVNKAKDRIAVEQTIESLNAWDEQIRAVATRGPGNIRSIDSFLMRRGDLFINSEEDSIVFVMDDLSSPYSESGVEIDIGRVNIFSEEGEKESKITMTLDYKNISNITYSGIDENKKFTAAPTPYSFRIENLGRQGDTELFLLDVEETSRG